MSWLSNIFGSKSSASDAGAGSDKVKARVGIPDARLTIDSSEYNLVELSTRNFRIYPYEGDLIEKQNFTFSLFLTVGGDEQKFSGRGIIRQITPDRGLFAQFAAPQPSFDRLLQDFVAKYQASIAPPPPPPRKGSGKAGGKR
ncbi:MAG: hypothetical protein WCF85_14065 [Rhodospirillaceae bacterium]